MAEIFKGAFVKNKLILGISLGLVCSNSFAAQLTSSNHYAISNSTQSPKILDNSFQAKALSILNDIHQKMNKAYSAAYNETGSIDRAQEEVKILYKKDIELLDDNLRQTVELDCELVLNGIIKGQSVNFSTTTVNLLSSYMAAAPKHKELALKNKSISSINSEVTQGHLVYANKQDLLNSLVSDLESDRWESTSNINVKTEEATTNKEKFSARVQVKFLGVKFSGGPELQFERKYSTVASIAAEGLNPIFDSNGIFDRYKRNKFGEILKVKGVAQKRYMYFTCNVQADVSSETVVGGELSFMGLGGEASYSTSYKNTVNLTSRLLTVPEYIDNKQVTLNSLSELCHHDFLNTKVNNTLTVKKTLNVMINNLISGLTYASPSTKCVTDQHCYNWFNKEVISWHRVKTFPRCIEESNQPGYFHCRIRGIEGAACTVYDKKTGKILSDGGFEYACDKGLKCVITKTGGWFQNFEIWDPYEAKCQPINPKTYKSPFERQTDYIEINTDNIIIN